MITVVLPPLHNILMVTFIVVGILIVCAFCIDHCRISVPLLLSSFGLLLIGIVIITQECSPYQLIQIGTPTFSASGCAIIMHGGL